MARNMITSRVSVSRERATQWFTLMQRVAMGDIHPCLAINLMTRSHKIAINFIATKEWNPHVMPCQRN